MQGYGSKKTEMMPNPKKYQAIVLGSKGCDINFQCANETIPTSNEINLLGVTLDSKLKFDAHIASVCRKVRGQVNALNRLKKILPCKVKELLYRTFVLISAVRYGIIRELKQQTFLIHGRLPEVKFKASHSLRMPSRF